MLQNATLSGNQRPDFLTALMNMSLALGLPRKMHLCRSSSNAHACHRFWKWDKTFTFCSLLTRCTIPCACHAKRHLNVKKWSEHVVFLSFLLRNVLRATTACTFSISQLPKVVRTWCALYILTSKCASRHNGVQFCISHLASWLFSTLRSRKSLEKHSVSRLSYLFAHLDLLSSEAFSCTWIFFLLRLSLSSLLFSDSSHLCFSSVHIVGSLTSKLPSISCRFVADGFWKCQHNRSRADWSLASCTFKTTSHPRHKGWQERTNKTFDSTLAERLRRVSRFLVGRSSILAYIRSSFRGLGRVDLDGQSFSSSL